MIFENNIQKIVKPNKKYNLTFWFSKYSIQEEIYNYILFEDDCTIYSGIDSIVNLNKKINFCKTVFKKFETYEIINTLKGDSIKI